MNIRIDLQYEQLKELVKQLTPNELQNLKSVIDNLPANKPTQNNQNLINSLLNGPTLTKESNEKIKQARVRIDRWRIK